MEAAQRPEPRRLLLALLALLVGSRPGVGAPLPSGGDGRPWRPPPALAPAWAPAPWLTLRDWTLRLTGQPGPERPGPTGGGWGPGAKRSLVVADDTVFRERAKLLTAMERQKWLNSYMQKMLLVNAA
ncbi:tuberoinfundibular peptide of 39 residues [Ornithorhynchus anatinus]|uniref:tuberoinfundibular peptide of 39 residues n=1 Tax=Ornithorhynchus anatinus TaxID=9258 RepID=UPI0010A7D9B2|nr:tuberoinfundibular peptide of 39 residues [Ornithorhynchus anatinus]